MHLAVAVLIVGALAGLFVQTRKIRRQNDKLEAAVAPLRAEAVRAPDELSLGGPDRFITIEILNASQLASGENKLGGLASAVAPQLVNQIVYTKAVEILKTQLALNGVEADVHIHVR